MKVGLVALHYPDPGHWDEMISRVHRAAEVMAAAPGCLSAECWVSDSRQAVVTTGQWESEQALAAGFAAVRAAGVDFDYDERERRPREVFRLWQAARTMSKLKVSEFALESVGAPPGQGRSGSPGHVQAD